MVRDLIQRLPQRYKSERLRAFAPFAVKKAKSIMPQRESCRSPVGKCCWPQVIADFRKCVAPFSFPADRQPSVLAQSRGLSAEQ